MRTRSRSASRTPELRPRVVGMTSPRYRTVPGSTDLQVAELPALEVPVFCRVRRAATPVVRQMLNIAPCHDPEYALREVTRDATEYYLREGESPGRWWGAGATALGLAGEVVAGALRDLFAGKHPNTGEYLISARGSSVRANARGAGADVDAAAAAALLGLSVEGVRARLRAG